MPDQLKRPEEMTSEEAYVEALRRIEDAERDQATELELYDLPLRELPPEIGRLTLKCGYFSRWRETAIFSDMSMYSWK